MDNLTVIPKSMLTERIATLSPQRLEEVCRALAIGTGCGQSGSGLPQPIVRRLH